MRSRMGGGRSGHARPPPAAAAEALEARRLLAGVTYYVSPTGNDANPGTAAPGAG